jgi:hypothetical protein
MKKIYFLGSIILFVLIAVTAFYGLFVPGAYSRETANWATQARAQDWADVLLAAPILLISAFLAYKKSTKAYLMAGNITLLIGYSSAKGFAAEMPVMVVFGLFTFINLIFAINYLAHIRNG